MRRLVALGMAVLCCAFVMANGCARQAPVPPKESVIVIAVEPDYQTLDPGHAYERYGQTVLNVLYDTLVTFQGDPTTPVGRLAREWTVSEDGKVYTFKLDPRAKFTSGNPVASEDVRWSFTRLKHLKSTPSFLADSIELVEAPDPQTVRIVLREPDAALLSKLATSPFSVLDSKLVKEHGGTDGPGADKSDKAQEWLDNNSAGSGPFVLEKFTPQEELGIKKSPACWQAPAKVDRIILKHIADTNTQQLMIERGDADIAFNLTSSQVEKLRQSPGLQIVSGSTLDIFFVLMNADPKVGGPVSNKLVQQAIRYAIDYEGICKLVGNNAIAPYSIIPRGFLGAVDPARKPKQDLEKARQLLKEAGYPNGFAIDLEAATFSVDNVSFVTCAQKIQDDLAKIGIKTNIVTAELTPALERYRGGKQAMSVWMWGPDYPDANNQLAFLPGNTVGLRAGWTAQMDPELAELGKRAITEIDPGRRAQALEQIQHIMNERGPFAVFLQPGTVFVARDNLTGLRYSPVYVVDLHDVAKK